MARFICGDIVQNVRKNIQGTVTEVHVVAGSISYTLVNDEKQVLRVYECDLSPCGQLVYHTPSESLYADIRNPNIISAKSSRIIDDIHDRVS